MSARRRVWMDCDPGHDDAIALLMALYLPSIDLLGISTVHGNSTATNTYENACRLLHAFAAPPHILAHPGATKPLVRISKVAPEIHGLSGLGGVEGLHAYGTPGPQARVSGRRAVEAMAAAFRAEGEMGGKVTLVVTGPMTNVALLFSVYPELVDRVEEVVFMGGGVGIGNRSPAAEFNILCDPESAQIVLDLPVKKIMVPLNVTHTAVFTHDTSARLLLYDPTHTLPPSPTASTTPLRHMLYTLIHFFGSTYRDVFGFTDGPPVHDAVAIAYVAHPEWFEGHRFRVDVELAGMHTAGETVVDLYDYQGCGEGTWGWGGKNVWVCETLQISKFIDSFLECVREADKHSPLNNL